MSLISTSVPNLINGVSQQPPALRMPTQCSEMVNCYPSIVEGLIKRPPLEHVAKLISGDQSACHVHMYQRDTSEKYVVVIRNNSIKVFDMDGVEKTVNTPDGVTYLASSDPVNDFATITVADYTFIVNKTKTVTMNAAVVANNLYKGMVFVKQGTYGGTYQVFVNGSSMASFTTSTTDPTQIATDYIANQLQAQLNTNLGAGWTTWRSGHVIMIKKDDGTTFTMRGTDPLSGEGMKVNTGTVQRLTDLPTTCKHGQIIKVAGDNASEFDDYWVKFTANDSSFAEGYWSETVGIGSEYSLTATVMPFVLVSSGSSFTFQKATWASRSAGDETSAPDPSFVGTTITDIVFFRDRLGLISGQNVALSRAGDYFNFWPETVTDVLDDAPIDVAAAHTKVALLRHAVPFNKQLLLFSDQTQFVLDSDELLTPKTAAITTATEFEATKRAKPVGAGHNVYFVTNKGAFSGFREYFVDQDTETNDAADITAHVPQYIAGDIRYLAISSAEDVLVSASDNTAYDHLLYLYKYYWQGNEKLQSSWGKWDVSGGGAAVKVRGVTFINSTMYLVVQRSTDGLFLEKVSVEAARTDAYQNYVTHLDRRITDADCTSVTYDSGTGKTTFTLPYAIRSPYMAIVTRGSATESIHGRELQLDSYSLGATTLVVNGDYSSTSVWIGNKYQALYIPSEPVVKEPSAGGGQVANQAGKLQVRNYLLSYDDTGYFKVSVTPKYRDTFVYEFTGRILGSGNNILGTPAIESGVWRSAILANSKEFDIEVESWSHLPMKLQSAEWEIFFTQRSTRR